MPLILISSMLLQYCYLMKPLNFSLWDTPNYGLVMKMHVRNNSLSSVTTVRKEVAIPMWHLVLLQHSTRRRSNTRVEQPRTLYNSSVRTCEFWKYIKRVNAWNNAAKLMLSGAGSNMSLACPLKPGIYTMNVIQIPPDTAILKFMYQPNTIYTVLGTVYSVNPKDGVTRHPICHYEVNTTIHKTC
ncbi:uncharacterized protein LOC117793990 [Drosophila innubila]|uniref:uncharacterized protein LOC117793990 n=1 Tax=Drosophila innubila TaxID=198719 RepID=UPI00148E18C3|nr:uncharacterized protein LOC117793990 [Drosophila innubila]